MFESKRRNQNSNDDWNRTKVGCSSGKRGHVRRKDHLHKMELCQSWFSGERCPYGSACNFAHDKSELRLRTYSERNKDASDFRTHPCFDQVSTGHCPFGVRCRSLHDRRVTSKLPGYIPVECKEFPVSQLCTTINVDYQYSTKISEIQYGPFGVKNHDMLKSYDQLSNHICNKANTGLFSNEQRLQIALSFAKSRREIIKNCFEYRATHIITDSAQRKRFSCMQIQSKVFDVRDGKAIESFSSMPPGLTTVPGFVTVREIAFCQDARQNKKVSEPVPGIFFDISDHDIKPASVTEIKELKRNPTNWDSFSSYCSRMSCERPFEIFYVRKEGHCGIDQFMIDVLDFELSKSKGNAMPNQKRDLEGRFEAIKRALSAEQWSSTEGSKSRKPHDEIPSTESMYVADAKDKGQWENNRLWDAFTTKPWQNTAWGHTDTGNKLNTMGKLSKGAKLSVGESKPTISFDANFFDDTKEDSMFSQWNMVTKYYGEKNDHKKKKRPSSVQKNNKYH